MMMMMMMMKENGLLRTAEIFKYKLKARKLCLDRRVFGVVLKEELTSCIHANTLQGYAARRHRESMLF
jgi:hypothetical protein